MNYTDSLFVFAFVAVVAGALALRSRPIARQWFLTIISLLVMTTWGVYSLALFLTIATANFFAANQIHRRPRRMAKSLLVGAIVADIATLGLFKYSAFFGLHLASLTGPIGIPLAISFYTFHIISYLVDVYRGKIEPVTFGRYLFYLSFFPHVVAGPIVRTWQLVPQLRFTRRIPADWPIGLHFFVTGFFLKSICADNIAGIIDPVWASADLSTSDRWLVAFFYYCQIYGDFAGYSLMALGMARLLGFRLPANFRSPLRACTLQEFWRRWHITLSRWLRDYLYIPLGGSRYGVTAVNLILTMLLGGLWHGAGLGFIIWGAIHGIGLAIERLFPHRNLAASWLVTQLIVTVAWVPFRLSANEASKFLAGMFSANGMAVSPSIAFAAVFALPVIVHQVLPLLIPRIGIRRLPVLLGLMTGVLLIFDLTIVSPSKVFLYFSF